MNNKNFCEVIYKSKYIILELENEECQNIVFMMKDRVCLPACLHPLPLCNILN